MIPLCFDTSRNPDYNMRILADGNEISIGKLPNGKAFDRLNVCLLAADGSSIAGDFFPERGKLMTWNLPALPDGVYSFTVFISGETSSWKGYIYGNDILLESAGNGLRFVKPPHYGTNRDLFGGLRKDPAFLRECLKPSFRCESGDPEVVKLARSLTRNVMGDYRKALAVHDWVAENIAYDYDSLSDGSYVNLDASPGAVLSSGKTVCQGFSDLFVSLLRAAGVPALSRSCFALGLTTDGGWNKPANRTACANHNFSVFFAGGRWVLTDVTWDHCPSIIGGKRESQRYGFVTHKYFDISLPLLSGTHRFCN